MWLNMTRCPLQETENKNINKQKNKSKSFFSSGSQKDKLLLQLLLRANAEQCTCTGDTIEETQATCLPPTWTHIELDFSTGNWLTAFLFYLFFLSYIRMITNGREKKSSRDELWIFNAWMIIIYMSKARSPAAHRTRFISSLKNLMFAP